MFLNTSIFLLILSSAMSKPRYVELDEDDQELYRTAYDTPPYHDDCEEGEDQLQLGKVELVKDGMWALRAKVNELKAFNKALAANLLSTKLKLKELLTHVAFEKKQKFESLDKKKPIKYQMQAPQYAQYTAIPYGYDPYIGI